MKRYEEGFFEFGSNDTPMLPPNYRPGSTLIARLPRPIVELQSIEFDGKFVIFAQCDDGVIHTFSPQLPGA